MVPARGCARYTAADTNTAMPALMKTSGRNGPVTITSANPPATADPTAAARSNGERCDARFAASRQSDA